MKERVAFVCYGGAHAQTIEPLIRDVLAEGRYEPIVLALTLARRQLEHLGAKTIGYRDLVRASDERAMEYGHHLAAPYTGGGVSTDETIAYLGLNYHDLVEAHGEKEAADLYQREGRRAFAPNATMRRWLLELAPAALVCTSSPRSERAAMEAAGEQGIPGLCVTESFLQHESSWIARPHFANRVTVLGSYVRDFLVSRGRPAAHIAVTGVPSFDKLAAGAAAAAGRTLRKQRGWQGKRVILWAMPSAAFTIVGRPFVPLDELFDALRSVAASPNDVLVLRPHPNGGPLPEALTGWPYQSDPREPLLPVLYAADVVVVETSTVGLEAALIGKPVVTVRAAGYPPYAQLGLATDVSDLADLRHAISEAPQPRYDLLGAPPPGGATEAVHSQLKALLS